jgi:hypothetical protein
MAQIHGEENDAMDDMSGLVSQQTQVSKRKGRRKKEATSIGSDGGGGDGEAGTMDTNGIGKADDT